MKMNVLRPVWTALLVGLILCAGAVSGFAAEKPTFAFKDEKGKHLDLLLNGKTITRYMYAHDTSTPATRLETYKPYLHVFDAEGKAPITKGAGGLFTHHRGIFIGWNKMGFNGKTYDRWHMKGGEQVHQKFTEQKIGDRQATFTSLVYWNDEAGKPILIEERTMSVRPAPAPAYVMVDFSTVLKAPNGDVSLKGDPEHAGVQFRPADEVVKAETVYVFPKSGADPKIDRDYPWVGETLTLAGKQYSIIHLNAPDNPKGTIYSAYRDYGRFGAFLTHDIKKGEALKLHYGFLILEGKMPSAKLIQKRWDAFAGKTSPSPVPEITVSGGVDKKKQNKKKK